MNILQWNICGYRAKFLHFQKLLDDTDASIVCLQETFLKPENKVKLRNFQYPPERKDRSFERGGGVLIYIKAGIPYLNVSLPIGMEAVAVEVFTEQAKLTICSLYIPPDYNNKTLVKHLNQLISLLPKPYIICTDANAHHLNWGSQESDRRGRLVSEWVESNELVVLNSGEPTHMAPSGSFTHIDLTIATANIASLFEWFPQSELYNSNHFPINIKSNISNPTVISIPRWNTNKANWTGFQDSLNLANIECVTPTETYQKLIGRINSAAEINIPLSRRCPPSGRCNSWWTSECTKTRTAKNRALSKYKRNRGNISLFIEFKKCRAIFRKTLNEAKKNNWTEYVDSLQPGTSSSKVWKKVKALNNNRSSKTIILKEGDEIISQPSAVADSFAKHFCQISNGKSADAEFQKTKSKSELIEIRFSEDNSDDYNREITYKELQQAITSCNSKSSGPDSIPFQFFKHFKSDHINALLRIFNFIYKTGVPDQWKESIIIPIVKPNKLATDLSSYRPIALTNCSCKIMEKIINWRLQNFLEKQNILSPYQSGFRMAHSQIE